MLLSTLDLSFNEVREIKGLDELTILRELYLPQNKITTISGLDKLTNLSVLELGSNRIRVRPHARLSSLSCRAANRGPRQARSLGESLAWTQQNHVHSGE